MIPGLGYLLAPKWRTVARRLRQERARGGNVKLLLLGLVGLVFWSGAYGVSYRLLKYFRGVEEIGPLLASRMLGLALISFIAILILSNVITALSSFFLAKDLDLLVSAPVDWLRLYLAKLGETLVHSSWMVALMSVPILVAYGVIYQGGWLFAPYAIATMIPFLVIPCVIGSAATLILVNVFPARRARDLLSIIAIAAAGVMLLLFRMVRPERLARPEGFRNLLDFMSVLRAPDYAPVLPSEWAAQSIMGFLTGRFDLLPLLLLWTTAAAAVTLGAVLHARLYASGYTRAQEAAERFVRGGIWH
ncbi:MAG: putative ABC transporter permease subunit, partial [Gemmatimonadales bacterium]